MIHVAILKVYTFICNTDSKKLFACIEKQYYDNLRNEMFNQLWIESKLMPACSIFKMNISTSIYKVLILNDERQTKINIICLHSLERI